MGAYDCQHRDNAKCLKGRLANRSGEPFFAGGGLGKGMSEPLA
jgi:hypothetical protein